MRTIPNTAERAPTRRLALALTAALTLGCLQSCDSVKFYEKRLLADPIMAFGDPATEAHFFAKSTYSREGSVGGIGSSAGGGCGCY
jgi:hypothetical protein